ncbi:YfhO family protein [Salegentibacter salegens]|uniref:Membrane protein YfhO n=1 Tax=Salegentibacter salegens TaxID=143223 RepID=A0A1M7LH46_9FLAO|nr:YfhO family protein [Salegentibacter salegens]PRX50649.1 membrane protein YfhO [Salegentibacter salegens]SHM76974.1 membrane protein YfhO [Salegentibacter salegens]
MANLKKFLPHLLVLVGFVIVSLFYFSPVLEGKKIFQSDIVQYIGMAKEQNDFRDQTGQEPYWTDSAFGGMPTFQLGAYYPHNYVKKLDSLLRFLPRPADYLFLYFIGFYILLLCLKLDFRLAFLGALAFGFSTYLIIILGVGHNAKAHAIAYMPMVLGGIILTFRQKYLWGFLLLSLAMALQIGANHFQMTYYLLLLVIVLGISYLVDAYRKNILPKFFKALGVMVVAVVLAIGANATNLLATQEYTAHSTRGDTGLTISSDGSDKPAAGLTFDYITNYSYGIAETIGVFIPRFMGGSNAEDIGKDAKIYDSLIKLGASPVQAADFAKNAPTYWGDQPYVAGSQLYVGSTMIFFFIFALYLVRGRLKWWIVGGSVLALILSWGKNFGFFTEFFINYIPLYNKFRAVTSIQVIFNICIPLIAIVGISRLFSVKIQKETKVYALKWTSIILGGIGLALLLFRSVLFDFSGAGDSALIQQLGADFVRALKEDRKAIYTEDLIRSLIFSALTAAAVWLYIEKKITQNWLVPALALLILVDLIPVDKRYVNNDDFVNASQMDRPFQPNEADQQILQDDAHYRVFDVSGSPFNTGRTSYFHNAIGGYHAAKPGRMQDLYDFYISQNNMEILNMLNAKYFIVPSEQGSPQAQENPNTFGNAWFVNNINWVESANEEILNLKEVDLQNTAVINSEFESEVSAGFEATGNAEIQLQSYQPNELVYKINTSAPQFAIFSEMYYQPGWQAYLDGEKVEHVRANYLLRAMNIPAGEHTVTFRFEPEVVNTGSSIALASSIILVLIILGGFYYKSRKRE